MPDNALTLISIAFSIKSATKRMMSSITRPQMRGWRVAGFSRQEPLHPHGIYFFVCHFLWRNAFFGTVNDLIIHICKVGNVGNFSATILKYDESCQRPLLSGHSVDIVKPLAHKHTCDLSSSMGINSRKSRHSIINSLTRFISFLFLLFGFK